MIANDLSTNGETNTSALIFGTAMQSLKDGEYLFKIFFIESNAIVFHFYFGVFQFRQRHIEFILRIGTTNYLARDLDMLARSVLMKLHAIADDIL